MSATPIRVHYPGDPKDVGTIYPSSERVGVVKWRGNDGDEVRRDNTGAWWIGYGDEETPPEVQRRHAGGGWSFLEGRRLVTITETP